MRISQLEDQRVALWGWGREGRAAHHAIRARLPAKRLTLLCNATEAEEAGALGDARLEVIVSGAAPDLSHFDVIVKSPGISPHHTSVQAAVAAGAQVVGGTGLWFAERPDARTFCVTGTKGKSTTTALLAHLLRAAGIRTALCGNIGLPLLDLLDEIPEAWAIELSSYQTRDVAQSGTRPSFALITNLYPEHLDWHGSEAAYFADKLALVTDAKPEVAVLNASDRTLSQLSLPMSRVVWFNHTGGWHARGDVIYRGDEKVLDVAALHLPGMHNRTNVCGVLAMLEAAGFDAHALARHALGFQPLPHRLQPLGERDGLVYVNDSISTTPHATLAALDMYREHPVAVIVGGHDRGLDWSAFASAMRTHAPRAIVTVGQNGPRIHALLESLHREGGFTLHAAANMGEAVHLARESLPHPAMFDRVEETASPRGVVLLSPGAPSFGAYTDYVARGRHFAELAGFDPASITTIAGMGVE